MLAKFGVRADQVLDLLTLTGDAVDNVPGVPKVGPKTAAKWLAQYGSLDNVIAHADEIPRRRRREPAQRARLAAAGQAAAHGEDRLRAAGRRRRPRARRAGRRDGCARCTSASNSRAGCATSRRRRATRRDAAGAIAQARGARRLRAAASTIAETPRSPRRRHAGGHRTTRRCSTRRRSSAGSRRSTRAELVCVRHRDDEPRSDAGARSSACRSSIEPGQRVLHPARAPLCRRARPARPRRACSRASRRGSPIRAQQKLGQNVKYDQHVLANHGLALAGVAHDTLLESYVLESHKPHDMDSLAWRHLDVKTISYDDVTGKGANRSRSTRWRSSARPSTRPRTPTSRCGCIDALYPRDRARCRSSTRVYATIEMPVREVLFRMERNGVLIDAALLGAQSRELGERVMALEQQAHQLAGQPFNLGSPKQLGEILFERMKLPVVQEDADRPAVDRRGRAAGARRRLSAAEGAARASRAVEAQVDVHRQAAADGQRAHRAACTRRSRRRPRSPGASRRPIPTCRTFRCAPPRAGASARRSSRRRDTCSSRPTIRRSSCGSWRTCREDPALLQAFHEGADIHRATAAEIFGVPPEEVTAEQRRYIKAVNFGLIYGMGAFGLAQQLDIERARRAAVHRPLFRALSGRRRVHAAHARARARAGLRRDGVRPAAVAARHQGRRRAAPRGAPSARRSTRRCRAPRPT